MQKCSNTLNALGKYSKDSNTKDNLNYIKMQFDGYWNFISNHVNSIEYLQQSQVDLHNYIANIEGKLSVIMFELYK